MANVDFDLLSKALLHLENEGWSDLIDKRWKKEIIKTLNKEFPSMNKETLDEVLNCVII
jgi:hypothetical protein